MVTFPRGTCSISILDRSNGDSISPLVSPRLQLSRTSPSCTPAFSPSEYFAMLSTTIPGLSCAQVRPVTTQVASSRARRILFRHPIFLRPLIVVDEESLILARKTNQIACIAHFEAHLQPRISPTHTPSSHSLF